MLIDSGADSAVFDASAAPLLGIDYRKGDKQTNFGIGGQGESWVWSEKLGLALQDPNGNRAAIHIRMAFAENLGIMGLVGREYFFESFRVTFEHVEERIILELREDTPHSIEWSQVPIYKPPIPHHKQSRKRPTSSKKKR